MTWLKKSLIIFASIGVLLLMVRPATSFAVCIMPPGYDPEGDPDINLDLSGWEPIVDDPLFDQFPFEHPIDPNAPQLSTLIEGICDLAVNSVNMISGTDRPPDPDIPADYANLVCLATPVGAAVLVPNSGYDMGGGCEAAVLYATSNSIVLKYTPDDNIASGYTVYIDNFQVDPGLLAYYNEHRGSGSAPCFSGGERIGVSSGETCVAIRDTGTFMDPRWQEWWNQCPASALDLILKLIDLCTGELPPPGLCPAPFPEPKDCCPLTTEPKPSVLADFLRKVGNVISRLIGKIASIEAWVTVDNDLERSEQLAWDADYFWASNPRYDPRRIALPDEEPEEGMWPGAALRTAPPGYRPSYTWKDHRDEELKWDLPLTALHVDEPAEGRSEAFHPLLATASPDLWGWFINTPGLEESIYGSSPSTPLGTNPSASLPSGETSGGLGINTTSQPASPSRTTSDDSANPSQILGTQPLDLAPSFAEAPAGGQSKLALAPEYCTSVQVTCLIRNRQATCDVYGNCSNNCGHNHIETDPKDVYGVRCDFAGPGCLPRPGAGGMCSYTIPEDENSFRVTFKNKGDHDGCIATATCETTLDANGDGSCSASSGDVCGGVPSEVAACNLPFSAPPEPVCTEPERLDADISGNIFAWIINLIRGEVSVDLKPRFPLLENAYYLTGVLTEKYKDLKNEGVGGVFDAFLPPGSADFPTLDAPGTVNMTYHVRIKWLCFVEGERCRQVCDEETGECHEECEPYCIFPPHEFLHVRLPIINPEGPLLIWGGGSPTEALRQTQLWLAPPL